MIKLSAETGSLLRKVGRVAPKTRTPEVITHAAEIMEETPKPSISPYRITAVQELLPVDFP